MPRSISCPGRSWASPDSSATSAIRAVAEVAFEVVDACQSNGVGRRLIAELVTLARLEGIERFRASVVVGNEAALALLSRAGRVADSAYVDGAYQLVVELGSLSQAA